MTAPAQAPTYQALYRACIKEAATQGRTLMQRLVVRAAAGLQKRAAIALDDIERRAFLEAEHTLVKHEPALCESYPQALLTEFAHAIAGDTAKAPSVSFDSLELMGEEQIRENVEIMRMQHAVDAEVEAELTHLNALISSVQGLKSVQPDRNPLRPQVYVRALRTVTLQSPVPSAMRGRWLLMLGEALGPELARMYGELAEWMRTQGVAEARFNIVQAPEPVQPPPTSSMLNLHELRKLVSGSYNEFVDSAGNVAPPDFSKTMPAAFEALKQMKQAQVDLVAQRMRARQEADAKGREPAQVLAQEVVRLMVENIANDKRLLAPVQQCVRDLEPALMRLARDDPRFFIERTHPARRLLNELTQRSLAWESIESPGFKAFIEPLRQAVEVLASTRVPGGEPFDFALKTLEDAWGDAHRRDRHQREKAVRALLNAEQRNLLAEKVAKGLRARPDVLTAPKEIVAFLTGPWAQVIAQARLADTTGAHDPGGFTGIVTDLVWSTQPAALGQTARLLKLVPLLAARIREGLATIGYPAKTTDRFLAYLTVVHRAALRGTPATEAHEGTPSQPQRLTREELDAMMGEGDDAPGAWLAPEEAQESGFMETQASVSPRQVFAATQPNESSATRPPAATGDELPELPIDDLQPGAWVEMMTGPGWQRFQVSWASPHGTLFMFTGKGGQPQSMTRRLLAKMLKTETLKLVSGQAVVEGALDAVAEEALRNTAHSKL